MLLDGSQMTLASMVAGTIGFLKKHDIDPAHWIAHIGEMFEGAWEEMEGEGADAVMVQLLNLSILPMGGKVLRQKMSADSAEVEVSSLPDEAVLERFGTSPADLLEGFDITARDFAVIYELQRPPLEAIGLRFTHGPGKKGYVLKVER
jgi:hypothetical protein